MPSTVFETPQSFCRFGIARRDITPPVGIYHRMWGAASHDQSEGVHRPLTATALVLGPAGDSQPFHVIIAVDHCLLFHREMEQLLDRISNATDVSRERLLVVFSHTHAAGLMEEHRADLPGGELIAPYLETLAANVADGVRVAIANQRPVNISYATGRCALAGHRDLWDEQSHQFVCGFNPDGDADDTVLVARVTDEAGTVMGTLANYACHPTTLSWDNRLISPDFVGAVRETVEDATSAPCVFLQGTSGDLGPREGFVGDTAVADRNGRQLGHAALAALESLPPPSTRMEYSGSVISGATIGTWKNIPLSAEKSTAKQKWHYEDWTIPLRYRDGLTTLEETQRQRDEWLQRERIAREAGDDALAADARAMVERKTRQLTRLEGLPPGDAFPYPVRCLHIGDAVWLAVEGEPYQQLQRAVRERFPHFAIVVMELANGSRCGYLPTAETYGKGVYQESIALLERGCLETLIDAIVSRMETLLTKERG